MISFVLRNAGLRMIYDDHGLSSIKLDKICVTAYKDFPQWKLRTNES